MNAHFSNKLRLIFVFTLVGSTALAGKTAAADESIVIDDKDYPQVYAAKKLQRFDKDGNGCIDEPESGRNWQRLKKLDTNQDNAVCLEELKQDTIQYLETGGERKLNIRYKQVDKKSLHLDLYYPTGKQFANCPVIFYTHGGGWAVGSKHGAAIASFAKVFKQATQEGFAIAAVNYRLWSKGGTSAMRDCVIDCKDAMRFLSKHCDELKVDPNRFFVMGDSAGGQIAQMLLLSSPESLPGDQDLAENSYKMVAGVSWYGPCDFEQTDLFNHDDREGFRDRFGPRILKPDTDPKDKLPLYREMSPVNYLTKGSPPLLMIQGDKDTTIPVKHAYRIQQQAKSLNAPVEILIIKNAGHNWRSVGADIDPSRNAIIERTIQFFVDHR
ncbi:alpha/beta hydrolase fold [Neorhodopirellula lusitana]|uniref:Alpha/beta hydrolase fold n=1 Tax=Neorhodopirellula lusitana TaxID=445327 RepID=A0ABY1QCQ3_9BACT|nr:alpha/beta hydrolase fold domain-containing protein [Neorhodopirellula lusitana]SMP67432.1 alpha/beta hydrolase fold [Neorhodopirellula lusitana]